MIKFPTTISEYTDSKLWRNGVDESIARRILVDFHKLEDRRELDLRKMYLAHYYCQIGEYRLAMTLAKGLLLECKLVDDAISLMKRICILDKDVESFARLIKLTEKIYHKKTPMNFFDSVEDFDISALFSEDKDTGKGKVVYNGNMAEYYKNGELVFSVEDMSCEAFFKDSVARHLLTENQPEAAIELLSSVRLDKIKSEIKLFCHHTFVVAHCMLEEYDKAYEYCGFLMEKGVYLPEMSDIFYHLYKSGSQHFEEMKKFFVSYTKFDSAQLADMHSLSKDIDDIEFWNKIYSLNPIASSDKSEDTHILKGMLAFNDKDYALSDKLFKQSTAIYGRFGKSWLYRYYVDCYLAKRKRGHANNMPEELYAGRIDDLYDYIDKKLLSKLKKCQSREDFLKKVDDYMLELDNMLSGVYAKICDVVDIVNRVYKFNYIPACELINRVAVNGEYDFCIRAICLANFMMYGNVKKFAFGKEIYDNPFARALSFQIDGEKEPFAYGIAIYLATSIFQGIDNDELKRECSFFKKIYSKAKGDYSQIAPLAVFSVLLSYLSEERIQYVKDAFKKREVKEFAKTYIEENGFKNEDEDELDDDVFDFMNFCLEFD